MTTADKTNPPIRDKKSKASTAAQKDFVEVTSEEIFKGKRELRICHGDREYRLRITRLNKLIMTV